MGVEWQDGRRAWERLAGWQDDRGSSRPDGDGALKALADVGLVRHLLDQAELVAVRTARRTSQVMGRDRDQARGYPAVRVGALARS